MSSYIHLTSKERKGVLGAFMLMIFIVLLKIGGNEIDQAYIIASEIELEEHKDSIIEITPAVVKYDFVKPKVKTNEYLKLVPKRISPNYASVEEWMSIGIPPNISERLFKYIKLKDGIREPDDLLSVYGFKEDWLEQLKDSIDFTIQKIDIQTASELELISIKGIGEVYANRILKYRSLLGGYCSVKQLEEVYGVDETILLNIADQITCSGNGLVLLDINRIGYNDLRSHPYISNDEAMKIIQLRSERGMLNIENVKQIFPIKKWSEISNYLK